MRYNVTVKLRKDFIEVSGKDITVGVTAVPEKGKANKKVIEKIAGYFGIPRSSVRIVSGAAARKKIVEII